MGHGKGGDDAQGGEQGFAHRFLGLPGALAPDQYRREQQRQQKQDVVIADQNMMHALAEEGCQSGQPAATVAVQGLLSMLVAQRHGLAGLILIAHLHQALVAGVAVEQQPVVQRQ